MYLQAMQELLLAKTGCIKNKDKEESTTIVACRSHAEMRNDLKTKWNVFATVHVKWKLKSI